ncbi:MAG TPA: hypothetical protein VIF62_05055 [Labilithrix sp.]
MRTIAAASLILASTFIPLAARADPGWFSPTPTPTAPTTPPSPATPPATAPAKVKAAPAGQCAVDRHAGVEDADAETVEQIVCAEVRGKLPNDRHWRVRVSKLGGKVLLGLAGVREDGEVVGDEKQLVLATLDEVPVAAPRLVEAAADLKPVAETQDMTNIVGIEARTYKKKTSEVHALLSIVGLVGMAPGAATGAGAQVGLSAGSESWAFLGDLRLAGGDVDHVALSGGVRHYFSTSDTSPFVGIGMGIDYVNVNHADGGGLALYGELGLDLLRTRQFGGAFSFRLDAPTFSLEGPDGHYYSPVLASTFSMRF